MTCGFCCFEEWADLSLKNPKSKLPCGMFNLNEYVFSKYIQGKSMISNTCNIKNGTIFVMKWVQNEQSNPIPKIVCFKKLYLLEVTLRRYFLYIAPHLVL